MNHHLATALVVLGGLFSAPALAQVKVHVSSTAPDSVGGRLVFGVKEAIRRSSGMTLAEREQDALISVRIVTLDPDTNNSSNGYRTIYSLVWTARTMHATPVDMYLSNSVGLCGSGRVAECAEELTADTDKYSTIVVGWIQDALRDE